jgi:capsular polysaccharide biosynthesis protein
LADGKIGNETVMPGLDNSIAHCLGGGLGADNLAAQLRGAPEPGEGIWAPLLSHWSYVYGHAMAQSMVHDSALDRAGLSALISYAAPAYPRGAQAIVVARAHSPIVTFASPLVKVPKAVFASQLYKRLPLGTEFVQSIARAKARILLRSGRVAAPHDKIYVSRLDVSWRRMLNEAELIEHLSRKGVCHCCGRTVILRRSSAHLCRCPAAMIAATRGAFSVRSMLGKIK